MIQIVELENGTHRLGKGQAIETVMAKDLGTKVFRIYEPPKRWWPPTFKLSFDKVDIDQLVRRIKQWHNGNRLVLTPSEIRCRDHHWSSEEASRRGIK